jgi:hypothetical protein
MRQLWDSLERYALFVARRSSLVARRSSLVARRSSLVVRGAARRGAGQGAAWRSAGRGGAAGRHRVRASAAARIGGWIGPEIYRFSRVNAYLGVSKERLTDAPSSFIVHEPVRLPGKDRARIGQGRARIGQGRAWAGRQSGTLPAGLAPHPWCAMSRNDARRTAKVRKRSSLALEKWTMRHASMTDRGSRDVTPLIAEAVT